jgi:SNF2 family DNA or RNA helicase
MGKPIATLRQTCPFCGKVAVETKRQDMMTRWFIFLECGHCLIQDKIETPLEDIIVARNGHKPYDYQLRSAKFAEEAGLNCILAHEMGVGKMVIAAILAKRNEASMSPILFVTKSGLRYNTWMEFVNWSNGEMIPQIIENGNQLPYVEYFPIVIISYDTLRLVRPDVDLDWERLNAAGLIGEEFTNGRTGKKLKKNVIRWDDAVCSQFKSIILDECQMIKNPASSRCRAIKKIASAWQRTGSERPSVMGLSGTPIKNSAHEYAPILHLVNPTLYPSEQHFIQRETTPVGSGSRCILTYPDRFHEKTKGFIQRFTRAEVLPELPAISRMFRHAEMGGDVLERYKAVIKEFQEFMSDVEEINFKDISNILGYFSRMRRLTGEAKVPAATEFVEEFLTSTDRKLVIFTHHNSTRKMLYAGLSRLIDELNKSGEYGTFELPLMLISDLTMEQRQDVLAEFKGVRTERSYDAENKPVLLEVPTGKNFRIMIASTQSAGEGLNMQFCSDCLMMERQWNPSNEEQAEARFPRPGQLADKIMATYLIAAGSIDDFLTELVERKRSILHATLDNVETIWDESDLMRDLADVLNRNGLKKWAA